MPGPPPPVTDTGDIIFHAKAGASIPVQFELEDGSPHDMTGKPVFIEVSNGYRAQLASTEDDSILLLVLEGEDFENQVHKRNQFVVIDESVTPPDEVWAGKFIVQGW